MLNSIIIMGRLVADPIMRQTGNGIAVCSFRIACDRPVREGEEKKADFIDCVAWRKTGEFVNNYFAKGKPILISGRLQIRDWKDKDGNARKTAEVIVNEANFCGGDKVEKKASEVPPVAPGEFADLGSGGNDLPWIDDPIVSDLPL